MTADQLAQAQALMQTVTQHEPLVEVAQADTVQAQSRLDAANQAITDAQNDLVNKQAALATAHANLQGDITNLFNFLQTVQG